jgi:hypothetical protein
MKTYFNNLQEFNKPDFMNFFLAHIQNRETIDITEKQTFDGLQMCNSMRFYFATLNEMGLDNLVVPHHAVELELNKQPDRPVKTGGEAFTKVIRDYSQNYIPNLRFPKCGNKALAQQSHFFNAAHSTLQAEFLFISNDRNYAHPGHYDDSHGEDKIFIGNGFHRFIAYGLWISQYGFKLIEVYYVENMK